MDDAETRKAWGRYALLAVPAIVLAGSLIGVVSGSSQDNDWYQSLAKPAFTPPGWLFPVAWTALYTLMGIALAMILAEPPSDRRRNALILFFAQLALNFAWSPVFFAAHDIKLASMIIYVMLALAAVAAGQFFRIRALAGALLVPYLAWLCFAAVLNTAIDRLNPAAGTSLLG